jgi:hypothetical protein
MDKIMKRIIFVAAILAATCASAIARPPDGYVAVTAKFTPSSVAPNQNTTFSWSATSGAYCEVTGLPGGTLSGNNSGSLTFAAQNSLTASVVCENGDAFGSRTAALTVSNAAPTVTTSFTPSTVYIGGAGSTFKWSSTMATSCSSPQNGGVSGTSGSIAIPAAGSASQQSITVNCVGVNGSGTSTSTLSSIVVPPQPPVVMAYASPSWLQGPGFVSVGANTINATSCWGMGGYYVSFSTSFSVTCTGPGGSATGFAFVTVSHVFTNGATFAQMSTASKDAKPMAAKRAIAPVNLAHLGIDLSKKRFAYLEADLNKDSAMDLIVVDKALQRAHVILSKDGQYLVIAKTVDNVSQPSQVKSVFVPTSNAHAEIRVTVESQQ